MLFHWSKKGIRNKLKRHQIYSLVCNARAIRKQHLIVHERCECFASWASTTEMATTLDGTSKEDHSSLYVYSEDRFSAYYNRRWAISYVPNVPDPWVKNHFDVIETFNSSFGHSTDGIVPGIVMSDTEAPGILSCQSIRQQACLSLFSSSFQLLALLYRRSTWASWHPIRIAAPCSIRCSVPCFLACCSLFHCIK